MQLPLFHDGIVALGDLNAGSCVVCGRRAEWGLSSLQGPEGCLEATRAGNTFCLEHLRQQIPHVRKCCETCIHFGELRGAEGLVQGAVCLAPVTSQPPINGATPAEHRFIYLAHPNNCCELWTPWPVNHCQSNR